MFVQAEGGTNRNKGSSMFSTRYNPGAWLPAPHTVVLACVVFGALALGEREARAQGRDPLLNGTVIGAAVGAGVGLGVDALFNRASPGLGVARRRVLIAPTVWRDVGGVVVKWRW